MKVIIINGSPKAKGNTATAPHEVEKTLQQQGIETEWIHVGHMDIRGCIACNRCWDTGICGFNDIVNEISTFCKIRYDGTMQFDFNKLIDNNAVLSFFDL